MQKIVISRYKGLVVYLEKIGLIDEKTRVVSFANPEDVEGKHVIGIIPYWLAARAAKITEIQVRVPSEKRNKELSPEEIEFYASTPHTYQVREVPFDE